MGSRGPIPRENSVTRHAPKQNQRTFELTEEPEVPELPFAPHPMTQAWWDSWVSAPQTKAFTSTDWQALVRCAYLQEEFFSGEGKSGRASLAGEIRQIEAKLGATVADRDRLGWKVDRPRATEPEAEATGPRVDPRSAGPN